MVFSEERNIFKQLVRQKRKFAKSSSSPSPYLRSHIDKMFEVMSVMCNMRAFRNHFFLLLLLIPVQLLQAFLVFISRSILCLLIEIFCRYESHYVLCHSLLYMRHPAFRHQDSIFYRIRKAFDFRPMPRVLWPYNLCVMPIRQSSLPIVLPFLSNIMWSKPSSSEWAPITASVFHEFEGWHQPSRRYASCIFFNHSPTSCR
jgi:hypothetical protein